MTFLLYFGVKHNVVPYITILCVRKAIGLICYSYPSFWLLVTWNNRYARRKVFNLQSKVFSTRIWRVVLGFARFALNRLKPRIKLPWQFARQHICSCLLQKNTKPCVPLPRGSCLPTLPLH